MLATYSLLPIIRRFTDPAGISVEKIDISVAARILAQFPEVLTPAQRVPDTLAELGRIVKTPGANIIKLPNISASVPQVCVNSALPPLPTLTSSSSAPLRLAAAQRRDQGTPGEGVRDPELHAGAEDGRRESRDGEVCQGAKGRGRSFDRCFLSLMHISQQTRLPCPLLPGAAAHLQVLGSAVNPVLREGNSDRRVAGPVKAFARAHPHKLGAWDPASRTHVAHMTSGDYFGSERSWVAPGATRVTIEHAAADGKVTVLNVRRGRGERTRSRVQAPPRLASPLSFLPPVRY
jgi:isocitrate dehydrogenase